MTDAAVDPTLNQRFDIAKLVVLSGWSMTVIVCLTIISAAVSQLVFHPGVELGSLKEWAGMCLGFLLGNFVSLVKDFIKEG